MICGNDGAWLESMLTQPNPWTFPAAPTVPQLHGSEQHTFVAKHILDEHGLEGGGDPVFSESEDPEDAEFEEEEAAKAWNKYGEQPDKEPTKSRVTG